MHYEGPIYRPPVEADTLLLQVTVGCAHNKCTYCSMYKDVCFKTEKLGQKFFGCPIKRIFIQNTVFEKVALLLNYVILKRLPMWKARLMLWKFRDAGKTVTYSSVCFTYEISSLCEFTN